MGVLSVRRRCSLPTPPPAPQALYDCYLKLGPALSPENKQLLCWELIMVGRDAAQMELASWTECMDRVWADRFGWIWLKGLAASQQG